MTDPLTDHPKSCELSQRPSCPSYLFARNFGHQIAVTASMDHVWGRCDCNRCRSSGSTWVIDLIEKWKEGYEVVYAVRTGRERESWF